MAKPNSKEFKRVKNIAEMLLNSEGVEHDECSELLFST